MIEVPTGSQVTISLSNGQLLTGKVENWSSENISLRTSPEAGITIITHPERDIVFVYYKENIEKNIQPVEKILDQSNQEFEKVLNEPFSEIKTKKLAELRILKSKAEKEIVASQLKSHTISDVKKVNYGIPNIKKPGT